MKLEKNTALIFGAGAVVNAWAPVIRAMQPLFDIELTGDAANSYFARLVYLLRWFSSIDNDFERDHLKKILDETIALKKSISTELIAAQESGEIRPREKLKELVLRYLINSDHASILISTNWDTVVDEAVNKMAKSDNPSTGFNVKTLHIHGSIRTPGSLYLPTEVTKERYRTYEEEQSIGTKHGDIWRALEKTHRTLLYGISLSPLDAELCQTLACGWDSKNTEEIFVIDPDHKLISKRVQLLLREPKKVHLYGIHPDDLGSRVEYTK